MPVQAVTCNASDDTCISTATSHAAPGAPGDGKIMPSKLMKGRQAVYVDGIDSYVINPNGFGPGSLWGGIRATG